MILSPSLCVCLYIYNSIKRLYHTALAWYIDLKNTFLFCCSCIGIELYLIWLGRRSESMILRGFWKSTWSVLLASTFRSALLRWSFIWFVSVFMLLDMSKFHPGLTGNYLFWWSLSWVRIWPWFWYWIALKFVIWMCRWQFIEQVVIMNWDHCIVLVVLLDFNEKFKLSDKLTELGLDLGLGIGFGWYLCSIMVADH